MTTRSLFALRTLAMTLFIASAAHGNIVIDDFKDSFERSDGSVNNIPETLTVAASSGQILGGERFVSVNRTGFQSANVETLKSTLSTVDCMGSGGSQSCLSFSNDVLTTGIASLEYDTSNTSPGGFDLSENGANNAIVLNQLFSDTVATLTVTVRDANNTEQSVAVPSVPGQFSLPGHPLIFLFEAFNTIDFSKLSWLRLSMTSVDSALDLEFGAIRAQYVESNPGGVQTPVPLPAPLVLLASALIATLLMRRPLS